MAPIYSPPHPATLGGVAAAGGVGVAHHHSSILAQPQMSFKSEDSRLYDMIASRLRWDDFDPLRLTPPSPVPFQRISAHRLNDETVVVFVINKGKALLIEDGAALFPSDALVTQLRLLAET